MSGFLLFIYFILLRLWVFLSDGSSMAVQKHHKSVSQKGRVEKLLQKNRQTTKHPEPCHSRYFFIFLSCFWAFLGEGSLKTPFKNKTMSGPVTFFASDLPTHAAATGSPIICCYCLPQTQQHHGTAREAHYYRHQEAARQAHMPNPWGLGLRCFPPPPPTPNLQATASQSLTLSL
jgi:hypothetical protein